MHRGIVAALAVSLLGLAAPLPASPVQGLGLDGKVTFDVRSAYASLVAPPFRDTAVAENDPVLTFKWQINEDSIGDPTFDAAKCLPPNAANGNTPDAGSGGYPAACTWPSVRAIDGHSDVVANGDQGDIPDGGLTLPNGKYLVSITAAGFKIDGAHFTVAGADQAIKVQLNPLPLPSVTVRVLVFNDNAATNGQYDGVSEDGTDMSGFTAHLNDIAGEVAFDVYGNPLCTEYQTDNTLQHKILFDADGSPIPVETSTNGSTGGSLAGGVSKCIADSSGEIVIPNLGPNRYAVVVSPPDPQDASDLAKPWIQTTTLEGGHDWDTWNMEGSTGFDTELVVGGEATPFVHFGFVRQQNLLPNSPAVTGSIKGRLMVGRTYVAQTGGLPNAGSIWGGGTSTVNEGPVEDGWVSLSCLAGCPTLATDLAVYVQRAGADGTFNITHVPNGTYNLTVWDEAQVRLLDMVQVTVRNGGVSDVGTFPLAGWFTDLDGVVFLDRNGNGKRDGVGTASEEKGVPNFPLSLRTRVNTLNDQGAATASTDPEGNWSMAAYPLGQFLILEGYHPGYKTTGATWKLNNEATSHTQLTDQVDWNVLNIFGLGGHFDIGVQPYAPGENGGIVGTVSYDVTRNELNPRNAAAEDWQPGVPDVTMQLWRPKTNPDGSFVTVPDGPNAGAVVQLGANGCERLDYENYGQLDPAGGCQPLDGTGTEHWTRPTGCVARTADGRPAYSEALPQPTADSPCLEAPISGVQFGENGEVDGNYGFGDLGSGDYLVEAVPPADTTVRGTPENPEPLYKFTDEASINVFTGDSYVPQQVWGQQPGSTPTDPTPPLDATNGYTENTVESACAGAMHLIEVTNDNNPDFAGNGGSPAEGQLRPYCNVKLVKVQPRRSIAPIFHVYTDVPIPTRFVGYIIDDLNVSTDPKSIVFGEKAGMPNVPVGVYDFTGRLVYTAESDYNGYYEMLLPSTNTIACPTPSGVCPNVYRLVGNDPGQLGHPNANFNPNYRTIGTEFQGWPGVVHPVDQAPSRVSASFQLPGSQIVYPPACVVPAAQPEFYRINKPYGAANSGPYTIAGKSFGATPGRLVIGANTIQTASWTETTITFNLPSNMPTGALNLRIIASNGKAATNGITFHVIGGSYNPPVIEVGTGKQFDPATDPVDGSGPRAIQKAIDFARSLSSPLVVVYPNSAPQYASFNPDQAYFENLVVHSKLKLQGVGPGSTNVPGSRVDGRYFWSSNANGNVAYADSWQQAVSTLPVAGNPTVSEGQVIYVRPETNGQFDLGTGSFNAAIDGFTITGGDQQGFPTNINFIGGGPNGTPRVVNVEAQGGGIFVNAYANNTQISNNVFQSNGGTFGGAIRVGTPELGTTPATSSNHNSNVQILRNRIVANGGTNLAGAIGLFYGSDSYRVSGNDICGNASAEYGGGIGHYGRSPGGRIDHNRIYFNQSYDEAGGIMVAGELPTNVSALSDGSGAVTIDHNEITANLSNDDGGGIRFLMAAGRDNDQMEVSNNIIANNVATHEGGGIAIDDTPNVRIVSNTIVKNVTTATAMTSNGLPAPAGVATGANSALLQARLNRKYGTRSPKFSNPTLLNNIFADNRAGSWTNNGVAGIGLDLDTSPILRWDIGATDGSGSPTVYGSVVDSFATNTLYKGGTGYQLGAGSSDLQVDIGGGKFATGISKVQFVQTYDTKVSVANWRTFPAFRPAAIVTLELPVQQLSNYRLASPRPAPAVLDPVVNKGLVSATATPYPTLNAPTTDIDDGLRPAGGAQDIGADEFNAVPATDPPPLPPPPPTNLLDNFNRTDTVFGLGGNWTSRPDFVIPAFNVNGNTATGQFGGFQIWNKAGVSFLATQEVGATITSLPTATTTAVSLVLKANGSAAFGSRPQRYLEVRYTESTHQVLVGFATSANPTWVGTISVDFNATDVISAKATPSGVTVFKNGVQVGSPVSVSGWGNSNNNAGGQVGLRYVPAGSPGLNTTKVDDFFGGNS